ncbi:N-methylhydantoinase A/acetone carboxylase, beta subunit [Hoeflea sp. IMCC20628]|uniref:hydantoinase/oxoprolinase family protein n=1 Tax=Hoeflea sp. IMCC20628 TaxID=1620421 RepID=UPI00063BED46|nr:hydantoinase/oxoprolinase family protein [Hoeflea sp. IMCC20628]AKI02008.1 N-methylhydantoinase A/acetone carboxylase, beta subunit [Hoeflea sp. IMCC20628]
MSTSARIGADIGGTFTDLVLVTDDGRRYAKKVSSTPANPEAAVLTGVAALLNEAGLQPGDVTAVLHGTTVGSNAILQKRGGRIGLVTTKGFRDLLEIGRLRTPGMFDLTWDKPTPLVPRHLRFEIGERIAADGSIVTPLDAEELSALVRRIATENLDTLALCFLNSYVNPEHELQAADFIRAALPDLPVTASVSILPEQREYERTSTTVVNAYVLPVMRTYLIALQKGLRNAGVTAPLFISNSNGGLAPVHVAQEKPVMFISSGRAAGVVGAGHMGELSGIANLVAFDMGGTTASASLIKGCEVTRTTEYEFRDGISTPSRFIKAGGYLMRVPTVDVAEIGNGAGSIAHVDDGGLICVGPVSAGAVPGPACYGTGGDCPTLTDANLLLGYLPDRLAGGSMMLSVDLAAAAIDKHVAKPAGLTVVQAALGMRAIANSNMARAIRAVTVERGQDPRDFVLFAFGGAGPNHACDLASSVGIGKVVLPPEPGVFTASGMLEAVVEYFFIRSYPRQPGEINPADLRATAASLRDEASRELEEQGFDPNDINFGFELDMRFGGQDAEIQISFDPEAHDLQIEDLNARFLAAYEDMFGYVSSDGVETVNLRLRAHWPLKDQHEAATVRPSGGLEASPASRRDVFFDDASKPVLTPVYDRAMVSSIIEGPAIFESADTTFAIPPGATAEPDPHGNLVVTLP